MDYTSQNLVFRLKKIFRYTRLYGLRRTLAKVRGQYHMKYNYKSLPKVGLLKPNSRAHIGLIGCGNYAFSNIAYYLDRYQPGLIRGVMDTDINRSASLCQKYTASYYTSDFNKILEDDGINLIYIASNHASHAEYAISCISAGKHVHIEKPHVVSEDQLNRLLSVIKKNPEVRVYLGFNRPRTRLFKDLMNLLAEESGPLMINWFIAGHEIPDDHWYFEKKEGGRVLGNLCHWTDLTLQMVGLVNAFPCQIVPASPPDSKSDFAVSIIFADNSSSTITFSAKGHTFEGVREILNVHKGNLLGNLTDFQSLTVDILDRKIIRKSFHRDHGHHLNIINSLVSEIGEDSQYVFATAKLFLAIKLAMETGSQVMLPFNEAMVLPK